MLWSQWASMTTTSSQRVCSKKEKQAASTFMQRMGCSGQGDTSKGGFNANVSEGQVKQVPMLSAARVDVRPTP
eukprot:1145356-Pelagomonas_calceolata.AAC.1